MSAIDQPELPPYVIPGNIFFNFFNFIFLKKIIKQSIFKEFFYLR